MSGTAKLTPANVRWARHMHRKKKALVRRLENRYSIEGLARTLGVAPNTMEQVVRGMTWKTV
jgi:transposase-like protein